MKLASDDETLAENKVLILYTLNKANKPLTNDVLYKIVLAAANMNYFYFQQFLLDLTNNKYIEYFNNGIHTIYKITTLGKNVLELTEDILPGILFDFTLVWKLVLRIITFRIDYRGAKWNSILLKVVIR